MRAEGENITIPGLVTWTKQHEDNCCFTILYFILKYTVHKGACFPSNFNYSFSPPNPAFVTDNTNHNQSVVILGGIRLKNHPCS